MEGKTPTIEAIQINSIKEGIEKCPYYGRKIEYLRKIRNNLLKETDYFLLPDCNRK